MEALILLTLIGIFWLISPRRWRKRVIQPIAVLACLSLLGTSPWMAQLTTWAITAPLPADSGESADAIVVLGRGEALRDRRIEIANQLWRAKRAPLIFSSGMTDAHLIAEQLNGLGVPGAQLGGESCSQSTEENALYTAAILYPQGARKILLLTDPPHLWRSLLLFQSFGFTVIPHASPLPPEWNSVQQITFILREYVGLANYAFTGRFKQRSSAELEHPSAEIFKKFTDWNCRVRET